MLSVDPGGPYEILRLNTRTEDSWAVIATQTGQIAAYQESLLLALSLTDATRIVEVLNNGVQPDFDIWALIRRTKSSEPL
jgi:hypothetical protein